MATSGLVVLALRVRVVGVPVWDLEERRVTKLAEEDLPLGKDPTRGPLEGARGESGARSKTRVSFHAEDQQSTTRHTDKALNHRIPCPHKRIAKTITLPIGGAKGHGPELRW